ncbi:MAG TPA: lipopolysaccharide heptosyltransferase I, partial [Pseudomonadales bacterium]|nr:lipopolysaccharide heptosyltransferase I [Pseudomonadales bacterium]
GDVIHTLPAITDAVRAIPDIEFDWLVEENFAEIPTWHPAVKLVIPVAVRRWRKNIFKARRDLEWKSFRQHIKNTRYDVIIDAQGLLKSAWLTRMAWGEKVGLDYRSAREPMASFAYDRKINVPWGQHAVERVRQLFAQALNYRLPEQIGEYGIQLPADSLMHTTEPYVVFLHGTTWETKHWPEQQWTELAKIARAHGYAVRIPWGNAVEKERAERIAETSGATVLPRLNLHGVAEVLEGAKAVVSVDTGLGHLASALGKPCVALFGPTNPGFTGTYGARQEHLQVEYACAPCMKKKCQYERKDDLYPPCFSTISPNLVWTIVEKLMAAHETRILSV